MPTSACPERPSTPLQVYNHGVPKTPVLNLVSPYETAYEHTRLDSVRFKTILRPSEDLLHTLLDRLRNFSLTWMLVSACLLAVVTGWGYLRYARTRPSRANTSLDLARYQWSGFYRVAPVMHSPPAV
jgi:hypothetical protein